MTPAAVSGMVITPGASADRDHRTLVAVEDGLAPFAVERLTLATTSIPRAVTKVVDATNALAERLGVATADLVIGGRSFGGRACSVAAAEGLEVAGLVLLSYPLHPPGKPDRLRTDHFGDITVPTLFVCGDRDPFGSPDEFDEQLPQINGPVTMSWVSGAHAPPDDAAVVAAIRDWLPA